MNTENIIQVTNLVKKFDYFTANNKLTFDVSGSEIFVFLGTNGAGKTTAIYVLCRLSKPTSDDLNIANFDVYTQRESIKKTISYTRQKFLLYEDLTVIENIWFYGGIYALSDEQINRKAQELLQKPNMIKPKNTPQNLKK